MLESLLYLELLADIIKVMSTSNNATSAGNQQERLIKLIGWITGFVDGEGCFSISFTKQLSRKEGNRIRRGYRLGLQVFHEFIVTQGEKSLPALKDLKNFFRVGNIYINRRHDNHKEHLYRYTVRKREELLKVIIPFFEKNSLKTSKQKDFEIFKKCVKLMDANKHLTKNGLVRILKLAEKMNNMKSKDNLIRILRNQTPNSVAKK